MDKLRILPVSFVCGLLSTPGFAQLTTIGPGTPGVTESSMTLTQTSIVNGLPFYTPVFTPIPLGSQGSSAAFGSEDWDMTMGGCLKGCEGSPGSNQGLEMFDVSFSKPVSFVSALQLTGNEMGVALWAYDGADQLVGSCVNTIDYPYPMPAGCSKYVSIVGPQYDPTSVTTSVSVANSLANISTVLIGGYSGTFSQVLSVTFSATPVKGVPEPGTLSLLLLALARLAVTRKREATHARDCALFPRSCSPGGNAALHK